MLDALISQVVVAETRLLVPDVECASSILTYKSWGSVDSDPALDPE